MKLFLVFVFCLLVLTTSLALATTDPELKQCKHQCTVQRQYEAEEKKACVQRCEEYYKEKKERERGKGEGGEGSGRGSGRSWEEGDWVVTSTSPEKRLQECQKQCERQEGQARDLCRRGCQQKYERERGREQGEGEEEEEPGSRQGEEGGEGSERNPYVFDENDFIPKIRTQQGRIDVLQRFDERSKLLRGLQYYRVAILEANPRTFISPSHLDADAVLFVANGRGTISGINEDQKRESFNLERGDVLRVRAGTPVYIFNRDENEKLFIVKFIQPVNTPGEYEAFRASGGRDQESFYEAFSWELLEAALKTDRRRIEHIFQRKQEAITKASEEQIQFLSHSNEEGGGIWPLGGESSSGPFNLLRKRPVHSNNYGQLFEAKPNEHKQQLKDLDLTISLANITRGAMAGPYYNSRSTKISVVLDGQGYLEMACPHVSGGPHQQEWTRQRYEKIRSWLRPGNVFIVPTGHPVATLASSNNNLVILCFEVNAEGNTRYPLAGKNNVVRQWERGAKELSFGVKAREVDQVFGNQDEELFFPGPRRQQGQGRADA